MKKNNWLKNQFKILFNSNGWHNVTLILFLFISFLVFWLTGPLEVLEFNSKKEVLDYVVRFMIFEVPATITIFSFVYKEQKDASYSNTKISNVWKVFYWTIGCSLITLLFSIVTISENPLTSKDIIINKKQFLMSIIYSITSLTLLVIFIVSLIRNMDIRHSFSKTFKRSKKYHKILKDIYDQKKKYNLFDYHPLMNKYNHLIESNSQLLMSSMEKNNLLEIRKELQKVYSLSQDFYQHFINVESIKDLTSFLSQNRNSVVFKIITSSLEGNSNKDNIIEIYNNILLNYKLLIRKSSDLGITKIQKQAFTEFIALNPVKLYNYDLTNLDKEDFDNALEYYEELTSNYHRSLFEIIKEFSNEDTMEYSYLLEQIAESSNYFEEITSIDDNEDERIKLLNQSFINKVLTLIEAIIISPIGTNNVKFLTESTNILLRYYYTQVPFPFSESDELKKKLRGEEEQDFLDQFINKNKDLTRSKQTPNHFFKHLIVKEIIRLIIHALHKSIELGHYQCTGYLTKICCSHLTVKNFYQSIIEYTNRIIDRQNISYDLDYYHYSINNFSKFHCIQKMVLILNYQMLYRFGESSVDLLGKTTQKVFLNVEQLEYMLEKVLAAEKAYGMVAFDKVSSEKIKELYLK
jgi:hypothetical protein